MKRTRFYSSCIRWLALAALPAAPLLAQSPGTQENPILDTLLIQENGLFLNYRYATGSNDSTIWRGSFNDPIFNQNSIFVNSDTVFMLKAKRNSLWYYDTQYVRGITQQGDTLFAIHNPTAQYSWTKDGVALGSSSNRISSRGPGYYEVEITIPGSPALSATYRYSIAGTEDNLAGTSREHAISDSIAFPVSNVYQLYASSSPHDSIQWDFNGVTTRFSTTFLLKEDGNGIVYLLKQGKWYKQIISVKGIADNNGYLFTYDLPGASYQWFKDGVLIPDSNRRTLSNLVTANYTVKITLGSGTYAGQVCTYSVEHKADAVMGKRNTPYPLKDLIVVNGLEFSVNSNYTPDSLFWKANKPDYSSFVAQTGGTYIATEPGVIEALVFQNGAWYGQGAVFQGIQFDTVNSATLAAPVVPNGVYRWYFNDQLLPDETGPSLTPTQIGVYKVEITWIIGASFRLEESKMAVFTFNVTSLPITTSIENERFTSDNFQLYPNPANGYVSLQMPNGSVNYRIDNASASAVLSGTAVSGAQIDISNLSAGVYYVHFLQAEKQVVKRLVVR